MTVARSGNELDDYRSRGFASPMGFGKRPASVIVDLSNGFTDPILPLGSPADEVIKQDAVFAKRYASCFFGTEFTSRLRHQVVDTLVIAGCSTGGCVRATAVDACENSLRIIVIRKVVHDRSEGADKQGLIDVEVKYGDVISFEDALAEFSGCELTSGRRALTGALPWR